MSADTTLITKGGAELNLVGKSFYVNGEPALSLDSMAIDDDSYIELDENTDSPELKIPTFNVVNGKDGVSGTDGTSGETGTEGEDGEEGEEGILGKDGTEGEEGVAGTEGQQGMEGIAGEDGVEGDTGVMGYDGAEGLAGKQALNADETSGIDPVNLLARPTVSLNTADNYNVTAGTANMQLAMNNPDTSLVDDSTKVTVYDRATMQPIEMDKSAIEYGRDLESIGMLNLALGGLAPDKEYMVVVTGKYKVDEKGSAVDGTLFTKVFKTDSLGITIEKLEVTEDSVSVKTNVTATNVGSYSVEFFMTDPTDETQEKSLVVYTNIDGTVSEQTLKLDKAALESSYSKDTNYTMESNTMYYARIANVVADNQTLKNTGDTTIELKTLKKKPHKKDDVNTSISAMQPVLTANIKSHSMILSLGAVEDPDNGVSKYRYELYKSEDIAAAATDGTLASITPAFTKEVDALADQTFSIPMTDADTYVGRVVALFDDNEKKVEYSTLFSTGLSMSADTASLSVEFVDVNKDVDKGANPDRLTGNIKIKDTANILLGEISADNPLVLTISGEYEDVHSITFTSVPTEGTDYKLFYFSKDGLRANSVYTLVAMGPCETDGDATQLSEAEKLTYLAGLRGVTPAVEPLSLVSYNLGRASTAFSRVINLTSPSTAGTTNEDGSKVAPVSYFEYEAQILETLEFQLIHVNESGVERILGQTTKKVDKNAEKHASDFYTYTWLARSADITQAENGGLTVEPLKANTNAANAGFILTPEDFGVDNNDSVFFSGGYFKIKVVNGLDYTTKNVIPFTSGEDVITFKVERRHVQATNPNLQVEASLITNAGAISGSEDPNVAEDTAVGIRFRADYPYSDVVNMTYYIYRLNDTDLSTAELDGDRTTPGKLLYAPGTTGIETTDLAGIGDLVLVGKKTGGLSGGWTSTDVELYFKNTTCSDSSIIWYQADGTTPVSNLSDQTILKRGERYYIRYEVEADKESIDCNKDGVNDIYPNCAYDSGIAVPYYRSPIIELSKQMPAVERYPWNSADNQATWQYRIIDPDQAIIRTGDNTATFMLRQGSTAAQVNAATGGTDVVISDLSQYTSNSFSPIIFSNLTNNNFYAVAVPYKLSSTDTQENIISTPVQFKAKQSSAPVKIRCQGLMKTDSTPIENIVGSGNNHEKALINEGGYRYRLTLRGDDIANYAAVQVEISGAGDDGKTYSVTYDPAYFDTVGTASDDPTSPLEMYAYVYLDSSPLKALKDKNVTTATVKVTGYYSTNESGVENYISAQDTYDDKNFDAEAVFALKSINADGTESYRKFVNGGWSATASGTMNGSLFVPGNVKGNGFAASVADGSSSGTLTQRSPIAPLSVSDDALGERSQSSISLRFNESGMMDAASATDAYYAVEKLKKGLPITFADGDSSHNIQIGDIMPSVKSVTITPGARSAYFKMNALGTGATADSKIYAKLYMVPKTGNPELLKVIQETTGEEASAITYYKVDTTGSLPENLAYRGYSIPLTVNANNDITAELRIRGLTIETDYRVVFFAYDSADNVVDLYSLDGKYAGAPYRFTTLKATEINVTQPSYVYSTYENKTANIGFAIPGDEGVGMTIHYELFEGSDTGTAGSGIVSGTVAPNGTPPNTYYAQEASKNNPITLTMNPTDTTQLRLGTTYTLRVYAVDSENENLGEKKMTFTTPISLKEPTFMVQASQSNTGSGVTIKAAVTSTDTNRSMMGNEYTIACYPKGSDGAIRTDTVKRDARVTSSTIREFSGTLGTEYVIKIKADIDTNNDGIKDKTIENEYTITASSSTSATVGASATTAELTLLFSNLQNFSEVNHIIVTAFDSDYVQAYTTTIDDDPFMIGDAKEFSRSLSWGTPTAKSAGNYIIQIQYRNAAGENLGNDEISAIVSASGTRSGFSLRSLMSAPTATTSPTPTAVKATQAATPGSALATSTPAVTPTPITEAVATPTPITEAVATSTPIAEELATPTPAAEPTPVTTPTGTSNENEQTSTSESTESGE